MTGLARTPLGGAIFREAARWPGVRVHFEHGGKHPVARLHYGDKSRQVRFAATASDHRAALNVVGEVRRALAGIGARPAPDGPPAPRTRDHLDKPVVTGRARPMREIVATVFAEMRCDRSRPFWRVIDAEGRELSAAQDFATVAARRFAVPVWYVPEEGARDVTASSRMVQHRS